MTRYSSLRSLAAKETGDIGADAASESCRPWLLGELSRRSWSAGPLPNSVTGYQPRFLAVTIWW
jgi:hypothetical protein